MPKSSALALVLSLLSTQAFADELSLEVAFQDPVATRSPKGDVLTVPGTDLAARPGEPLLPRRTFTFVVPYGHRVESLRVEAVRAQAVPGRYDLAPAQRPVPLSARFTPAATEPDPTVYLSDAPHPAGWATLDATQVKHGVGLALVTVHPLAYRPLSKRVERLVSARLVLTTKPAGRTFRLYRAAPADLVQVARRADAAAALQTYPKAPAKAPTRLDPGAYDYLIVTPEAFVGLGGPDSLEALLDQRQALGLAGHMVTTEWVLANYAGTRPDGGQDDATRIREFLTDAYLDWGIRYVLLVGDADASEVGGETGPVLMPVRKLYVDVNHPDADPDELPSDLYYSCLDGDFDSDADGVYGEPTDGEGGGEVDLMAELYVGRAPVDVVPELRNFVAKTLAYEAGAGAWLQAVLMVGELLWNDPYEVWGGDAMDELVDGSSAGGFATLGFESFPFFEPATLYDRDLPAGSWSASDIIALLNEGPHVVNHLGHSDVNYNMRLSPGQADALVNSHPFLHYSQGCYNGSFDNRAALEAGGFVYATDCFAEHLVGAPHGAFAAVANSRYGWGSSMTDGPSQRFHRQFWDAFFAEGMATLGEALVDSKEDNAAFFADPYIRWVGYENNLLGDPAVALNKSLNTDQPLLGLYPPQLSFLGRIGDPAPAPQTIRVRNDGLDSLSFTVQADQAWVSVSPPSGDAPQDLQIQVDPAGLSPGLNTAVLTFDSPQAANSPLQAVVEYFLVQTPRVDVPHLLGEAPVLDGAIAPGEYDGALSLPIDEGGAGEVTMHLAVAGSRLHLAIEDGLDVSDSGFDSVSIFFDRDLDGAWPVEPGPEGMYMVMSYGGGRMLFMPVYNPGDGEQIDFRNRESDPDGFYAVLGMQAGHRIYELALDLYTSHLDVGPVGSFGMFLSVADGDQMGAGNDTGWWPPVMPTLSDQTYFGQLDMLPDEPWLGTQPGGLDVEAVHDRAEAVVMGLTVLELLGGSVGFTLSPQQDWLTVEPATGQTPTDVQVTIDPTGLDVGVHQGQLQVEAGSVGNSPLSVPVVVEILPQPAALQVDPDHLSVTVMQGDPDPVLTFVIRNAGEQDMDGFISALGGWVGTSPAMFNLEPGGEQVVEVVVPLTDLPTGHHSEQIEAAAQGAEGSPVQVPLDVELLRFNSAPPVPELLSPADGTKLRWPFELTAATVADPEGDPVTYIFELTDEGGQVVDSGPGGAGQGSVTRMPAELPAGTYRWRVEARDNRDATSGPGQERTLIVAGKGGCSCAQAGRPGGWAWILLLVGIGLLGRRRLGR